MSRCRESNAVEQGRPPVRRIIHRCRGEFPGAIAQLERMIETAARVGRGPIPGLWWSPADWCDAIIREAILKAGASGHGAGWQPKEAFKTIPLALGDARRSDWDTEALRRFVGRNDARRPADVSVRPLDV